MDPEDVDVQKLFNWIAIFLPNFLDQATYLQILAESTVCFLLNYQIDVKRLDQSAFSTMLVIDFLMTTFDEKYAEKYCLQFVNFESTVVLEAHEYDRPLLLLGVLNQSGNIQTIVDTFQDKNQADEVSIASTNYIDILDFEKGIPDMCRNIVNAMTFFPIDKTNAAKA